VRLARPAPRWVAALLAVDLLVWLCSCVAAIAVVDGSRFAAELVQAGLVPGEGAAVLTGFVACTLGGMLAFWGLGRWVRRRWGACTLEEGRLRFELVYSWSAFVVSLEDVTGWEETARGVIVHATRDVQEVNSHARRRGPLTRFLFPLLIPTNDAAEVAAVARALTGR
jgi:hypothetical protein